MLKFLKSIVWPWQYKKRMRELELMALELHEAGCHAVSGWYDAVNYIKHEDYEKHTKVYDWHATYRTFIGYGPYRPDPSWVKSNWEGKKLQPDRWVADLLYGRKRNSEK